MALKLRHLVTAVVATCSAVALAYLLPAGEPPARFRDHRLLGTPERRAEQRAGRELSRAHEVKILLERRNSLLQLMAQRGVAPGDPPALWVDAPLDTGARKLAEDLLMAEWQRLQPVASDIALGVAIVLDTVHMPGGLPRTGPRWRANADYLPPPATDGVSCLTIIPLGRNALVRGRFVSRRALNRSAQKPLLGPCMVYAAFGKPGRFVEDWFIKKGHLYGPSIAPALVSQARRNAPVEAIASRWVPKYHYRDRFWQTDYSKSLACAAGHLDVCQAAVLDTGDRSDLWYMNHRVRWIWRTELGSTGHRLLADLMQDLGRDRFGRFWRSPLRVDSAFASAMGTSLGEWTHQWATRTYGKPVVGPTTRPTSVILSLLFTALLVACGAFYTTRRQVR